MAKIHHLTFVPKWHFTIALDLLCAREKERKARKERQKKEMEQGSVRDKDGETDIERKTETERSESWGQKNSQR